MEISVVMPVYNESNNELKKSIGSILSQTFSNFEFIIIDDNPLSSRIKKILMDIANKDKRIRLIFNKESIGPSLSANKGVLNAHGEFIARMDSDDICTKNRLKYQINFILNNNLDLVCSNFRGFNDTNHIYNPYYGSTDLINQHKIKNILSHCNIAMGPTLFFNRIKFLAVNGYRNILAEDYDLIVRFIINNFRVGYQSNVLLFKRNRIHNLSNNHALEEFVINYAISHIVLMYKYKKKISLIYIYKLMKKIKPRDVHSFLLFKIYLHKFKSHKSIYNLWKCVTSNFSSFLVTKRNLWMLFINKYYKNRI